jgi:hypothetical protein
MGGQGFPGGRCGHATAVWLILLAGPAFATDLPKASPKGSPVVATPPVPKTDPNHCTCEVTGPNGVPIKKAGIPEFDTKGGNVTLGVRVPDGCRWTAVSPDPWIKVVSGASGTGRGTVQFTVAGQGSTSADRTGTVALCGQQAFVRQRGFPCSVSYAFRPNPGPGSQQPAKIGRNGGGGDIEIRPNPLDCKVVLGSPQSAPAWLSATHAGTGLANPFVTYTATSNTTGLSRTGTVTIKYGVWPVGARPLFPASTAAFTIVQDP